jgi:hypothetical protein
MLFALIVPSCLNCHTVFQGIVNLHKFGWAHLDLKPDNLCMEMKNGLPHPCVVDYGAAFEQGSGMSWPLNLLTLSSEKISFPKTSKGNAEICVFKSDGKTYSTLHLGKACMNDICT